MCIACEVGTCWDNCLVFCISLEFLMSPADTVNKSEGNCTGSAARHTNGDATLQEKM